MQQKKRKRLKQEENEVKVECRWVFMCAYACLSAKNLLRWTLKRWELCEKITLTNKINFFFLFCNNFFLVAILFININIIIKAKIFVCTVENMLMIRLQVFNRLQLQYFARYFQHCSKVFNFFIILYL